MRGSRRLRLGMTLALAATAAVVVVTAANAKLIFQDTFHNEETSIVDDFCGV